MNRSIASLLVLAAATVPLHAQARSAGGDRAVANLREGWQEFATYVTQSAEDMPAEKYGFRTTPEARSFGQIIGHVAGSSYMFCAAALGDSGRAEDDIEKTTTTKAGLVAALKASTAYCTKAYAQSDQASRGPVSMFGMKRDRLWALMVNAMHDAEQYGNLLPYLRINGITPPSSRPSKP